MEDAFARGRACADQRTLADGSYTLFKPFGGAVVLRPFRTATPAINDGKRRHSATRGEVRTTKSERGAAIC
jgi:hypothetical protein